MAENLDETNALMRSIAQVVNRALNPDGGNHVGFMLLVFPDDGPEGKRTNYISNCDRKSAAAALKEVAERFN